MSTAIMNNGVFFADGSDAVQALDSYVCPACRGSVNRRQASLCCNACGVAYEIRDSIPDFIGGDLRKNSHVVLRMEWLINLIAPIYETSLWYPLVLRSVSAPRVDLQMLRATVARMIGDGSGTILDVACGPGTFGRPLAASTRNVYGIDIARKMLAVGLRYAARERKAGIHFARARVESLPFRSEFFDAAICCGSLHLFADPTRALHEICRTLKPAARLVVVTVVAGTTGLLCSRLVRRLLQACGLHVFGQEELSHDLGVAGFALDQWVRYGLLSVLCAHKVEENPREPSTR